MSMCDNCIHDDVCGLEQNHDESLVFCADMIPKDKYKAEGEQVTKTGYWVEENINEYSRKVFCSECGCPPPFEYVSTGDIYSASGYGVTNKTKFCPNCGARMKSEDEE